jgi:PAS domain S-box-containing protein
LLAFMEEDRTNERLREEIAALHRRIDVLKKESSAAGTVSVHPGDRDDYYRFAIEHANDGVVILRGEQCLYFNQQYMELLGYDDPDELAERPAFTGVHPDDAEMVRTFARKRQMGEPVKRQYECRVVRKDGKIRNVEISSSLISYQGQPASLGYVRDITERKTAEDALRRSEDMYRNLAETAHDVIITIDLDGIVTYNNRACTEVCGGMSVVGMAMKDLIPPETVPAHLAMLEARRRGLAETLSYEWQVVSPSDGSIILMDIRSSLLIENGIPVGVLFIGRDITERKRAAEALRVSEERFRLMTENLRDAIWLMDMNLKFTYISPYVRQILGYEPDEFVKLPLEDIMMPSSLEYCMQVFAEEMETEKRPDRDLDRTRTVEIEHISRDGKLVRADIKMTFIRDTAGNAVGILGITRDITERKQAENDLKASEEKYRTLTNNIPDLIYSLDSAGNITTVSEDVLHRYGYDSRDVVGRHFREFIHPEDGDRLVGTYRAAIEERREFVRGLQFKGMAKDGTSYWFELNNRAAFDEEGQYLKSDGVLRDITERKDAELDRAILEERLQRAEKMEALGTLAGGVAHDLNNVLGVVVGYAEMLMSETNESHPFREHAENIMRGGEKAAAIVQDLLTLARRGVKTGKVVNLNTIVMDYQMAPEFYKLRSMCPKVQITTDLEGGLPNIVGSPVHLAKTVMNLFSNAMEAMPDGGLLTVRTGNRYLDKPIQGYDHVREGDYVVLSVSDTGVGIPASDLKRIFEPFYTKKVMGRSGTGLGLSVVWGTVKDHNGYIDVESKLGRGTTLTLYFPVTSEPVTEQDAAVPVSEYMGNGETVLVVDDVKGQRDLAVRMLSKLNYRVTSVSSGEEAVAHMMLNQVDLIVLDMIMDPGIDGMEAYRRILEIHPRQKAIIVSGFAEMDRIDEVKSLGVGTYVRKPYIMERLGQAVRSELDRPLQF